MGATGRAFTTFLRIRSVSEQAHEDNPRSQVDFRAEWRRGKIGLALQYIIQSRSNTLFLFRRIPVRHTTEQDGLGYEMRTPHIDLI